MKLTRTLLIAAVALMATACEPTPPKYVPDPISFRAQQPIGLNVATVDIVEDYQSPYSAPNVEHQFPITPAQMVKTWASERLAARGSENRAVVIIKDASVVEVPLPKTKGLKGAFTNDQSERYDARVVVEVKLYSTQRHTSEAEVAVTAEASRTIAENASLQDRERLYHEMTKELANAINTELEGKIRQYFGNYFAPVY